MQRETISLKRPLNRNLSYAPYPHLPYCAAAIKTLLFQSKKVQKNLVDVQEPFKLQLVKAITKFTDEVVVFDHDFELNGPMIPGLGAREASDR